MHYIKPTVLENEFGTSILYMGINGVFEIIFQYCHRIKRYHKYCKSLQKIKSKQIIIPRLTLTTRLKAKFIYQLNSSIKELCQKHDYSFIDNNNISSENLSQDRLHLNSSGKGVLPNNYVVTLNSSYFLGSSFTLYILTAFLKPDLINLKKTFV